MRPNHPKNRNGDADSNSQKLHKLLAQSGLGSRRGMEQLIEEGKVSVNGQPATVATRITPEDTVMVEGRRVNLRFSVSQARVLLYHKPEGEIVSKDDPEGRASVFDKLPAIHGGRWIAIGRLDINTSGLLLFTNHGDLANSLMHPRVQLEREYAVRLLGRLNDEQMDAMDIGVELEDGPARVHSIEDRGGDGANHWYHIVIKEGRNREVRRLFEALGLTVSRLIRVRFGNIEMPPYLKRGQHKELSADQVREVMQWAGVGGGRNGNGQGRPERQRGQAQGQGQRQPRGGAQPREFGHPSGFGVMSSGQAQPQQHRARGNAPDQTRGDARWQGRGNAGGQGRGNAAGQGRGSAAGQGRGNAPGQGRRGPARPIGPMSMGEEDRRRSQADGRGQGEQRRGRGDRPPRGQGEGAAGAWQPRNLPRADAGRAGNAADGGERRGARRNRNSGDAQEGRFNRGARPAEQGRSEQGSGNTFEDSAAAAAAGNLRNDQAPMVDDFGDRNFNVAVPVAEPGTGAPANRDPRSATRRPNRRRRKPVTT